MSCTNKKFIDTLDKFSTIINELAVSRNIDLEANKGILLLDIPGQYTVERFLLNYLSDEELEKLRTYSRFYRLVCNDPEHSEITIAETACRFMESICDRFRIHVKTAGWFAEQSGLVAAKECDSVAMTANIYDSQNKKQFVPVTDISGRLLAVLEPADIIHMLLLNPQGKLVDFLEPDNLQKKKVIAVNHDMTGKQLINRMKEKDARYAVVCPFGDITASYKGIIAFEELFRGI